MTGMLEYWNDGMLGPMQPRRIPWSCIVLQLFQYFSGPIDFIILRFIVLLFDIQ